MNADIFKGKWTELKGQAKAKWRKLTDDDLKTVEGKTEQLSGLLQKKYGYKKDEAQKNIDDFIKNIK